VRLTFHVGITPEMVSWLLYYGARVQVLTPAWLRERVAEEHRRAAGVGESARQQEGEEVQTWKQGGSNVS
jgi:hypothetical protein